MQIETNLDFIAKKSITDVASNDRFIVFLKQLNELEIDEAVFALEQKITPKIDCTSCGNCCKTLMINVEEYESKIAAQHLNISLANFENSYIEKSNSGMMVVGKIPCHFLQDNKCTIYLSRFAGCKEFPALHLPQIQKRLFTVFMHYGRCPIIYNVVEQLKIEVGFS